MNEKLGNLPLVVLGVTEQPFYGDELTSLQEDLLNLSTNSVLQVAQGRRMKTWLPKRTMPWLFQPLFAWSWKQYKPAGRCHPKN